MYKLVRNKMTTPGILLTIAVAIAFVVGAVVSHRAQSHNEAPVAEATTTIR